MYKEFICILTKTLVKAIFWSRATRSKTARPRSLLAPLHRTIRRLIPTLSSAHPAPLPHGGTMEAGL
jgi:hypothetical protein